MRLRRQAINNNYDREIDSGVSYNIPFAAYTYKYYNNPTISRQNIAIDCYSY